MTSVSGSRLVLYSSGLKSLLHRVTSTRTVSAAVLNSNPVRCVQSRESAPCRSPEPLLLLTPMDCHLQALNYTHSIQTAATAPPTDSTDMTAASPTAEDLFSDSVTVEFVVQPCPHRLLSDVHCMFPLAPPSGLSVVTVAQRSLQDMSRWSAEVEQERAELLSRFISGATDLCERLTEEGLWADFIEPSSGLPFFGPYTNLPLFETDERFSSLGFSVEDLGCCRVLRHSVWGNNVFVGVMFTNAPPQHDLFTQLQS